jgi:hypothetical protein
LWISPHSLRVQVLEVVKDLLTLADYSIATNSFHGVATRVSVVECP